MLDYLGRAGQGGAMTMPGAVPGAGQVSEAMSLPATSFPAGQTPMAGLLPSTATSDQYAAVTQQDGSILLHLKFPDGTLGPAVKIIEPIKPRKAPGTA